jgi:DNA-binding MarR family transcriptional regulator
MLDEKERTAVVQQFGRTYRAFMTAFESHVGVPMPRWRIMLALRDWPAAQPQKKLVEALGMDPGALTRQVQQLEQAGWIARSVDERDNRLTNVVLTEAGRQEIDKAIPARNAFLADTMDSLPDDMLRSLGETLTLFEARIAAVAAAGGSASTGTV